MKFERYKPIFESNDSCGHNHVHGESCGHGKSINDSPTFKLEELTVLDFKSGALDDFRMQFRRDRTGITGVETQSAKMLSAVKKNKGKDVLFTWKTIPTYKPAQKTKPKSGFALTNAQSYQMQVLFIDFYEYMEKVFETNTTEGLKLSQFREIANAVDVKLSCLCPAWHFGGYNYELTQFNASLYPTNIPNPDWTQRLKDWASESGQSGTMGLLCKHLGGPGGLMANITFWYPAMLNRLREIDKKKKK